jgi:magnesium chelatase accessory protein
LLVADNDLIVPPRQAASVAQRVALAEVHRLPGLGHLAHEEEPRLVAEQILKICRAHPAPPTES